MENRFAMAQSAVAMGRWKSPAIVTLAAVVALTALNADAAPRQARPAPPKEEVAPRDAGEPIMAIVSIKSQQVTFYDADGWILRAPVSTGTKERETPAGVFAIVEKKEDHRSNMYDDAWMPHMQRITWNGIALHGGPLPGYAASHGCVRMPFGFADKLFGKTRIGMRVIISPNDAPPVEFSHPALFMPKADAVAAAPARAETLAREAAEAAKAADAAKKAAARAPRETASLTASLRKLEQLKARADAELASADKALAAAKTDQAKAQAEERKQKAAAKAAEAGTQLDTAKADAKPKLDAAAAKGCRQGSRNQEGRHRKGGARREARARAGLDLHQPRDAEALRAAQHAKAVAGRGRSVRFQHRGPGHDPQSREADRHACVHRDGAQRRRPSLDRGDDRRRGRRQGRARPHHHPARRARSHRADRIAAILDHHLGRAAERRDQLSHRDAGLDLHQPRDAEALRRRNTHKPWLDGGEVFDFSIETPVKIRNPEKPIGTHVFTAMARNDAGLRWAAVTIDEGDDAKGALDRITIPQEVLDRIAPTALPRSSIIISDEPLSKETNYRTEFVAVLSNQPQGGFVTRKPTEVRVANDDGFSFYRGGGVRTDDTRQRRYDFRPFWR